MFFKNMYTFSLAAMLILLLYIPSGCSREEKEINKSILLNEPRKPGSSSKFSTSQNKEEILTLSEQDDKKRKKQMRTIDDCQKQFQSCVEGCGNDMCEEGCLQNLSSCEMGLPKELQTLKH